MSPARELSPAQFAKLRCNLFGLLRAQIPLPHRVVMGEVRWSRSQARAFCQLLDKCIPNLRAAALDQEHIGQEDPSTPPCR
jgi:hypothetical protein